MRKRCILILLRFDIWAPLRKSPDEVVVPSEVEAEVEFQVLDDPDVEG